MRTLALLAAVTGCGLYVGEDGHDPEALCESDFTRLRDPDSGNCSLVPIGCDDQGPSPEDWGSCVSYCGGLTEGDCLSHDGCRAVYITYRNDEAESGVRTFAACWPTAPSGPVRGVGCETLGAEECSRHDDCAAVHENIGSVPGAFSSCVAEIYCASDAAPPLLRNPDNGQCEFGSVEEGGLDPCAADPVTPSPVLDWGICGSSCEAMTETVCRADAWCRTITSAGAFVACWPVAPSGAIDGVCAGLGAYDCSRHSNCAAEHALDATDRPSTFIACNPEEP